MLKPGQILEAALWADGRETPEQCAQFEDQLREYLAYCAAQEEVVIGPLTMVEKFPGDPRVPPVPDNIQGPNVRLIVGEAKVLCEKPKFTIYESRFIDDLEPEDLALLRQRTRTVYRRHFPKRPPLTDFQCDELIDGLGPEAALDTLRSMKIH